MTAKRAEFDQLVRRLSPELYRFAWWLCHNEAQAQDLVQESFLRAWRSLSDLRDEKAAKAWLMTIVRREHARMYERKVPPLALYLVTFMLVFAARPPVGRRLALRWRTAPRPG